MKGCRPSESHEREQFGCLWHRDPRHQHAARRPATRPATGAVAAAGGGGGDGAAVHGCASRTAAASAGQTLQSGGQPVERAGMILCPPVVSVVVVVAEGRRRRHRHAIVDRRWSVDADGKPGQGGLAALTIALMAIARVFPGEGMVTTVQRKSDRDHGQTRHDTTLQYPALLTIARKATYVGPRQF